MKVDEVSINQVFLANRTLKIPYFQRPYVWGEANWEKFYNDIAEITMAVNEGEEPETYFMGSIILKKGKFVGGKHRQPCRPSYRSFCLSGHSSCRPCRLSFRPSWQLVPWPSSLPP